MRFLKLLRQVFIVWMCTGNFSNMSNIYLLLWITDVYYSYLKKTVTAMLMKYLQFSYKRKNPLYRISTIIVYKLGGFVYKKGHIL